MTTLKTVASWLASACLVAALYFAFQFFFGETVNKSSPVVGWQAILCFVGSVACSVWNPPPSVTPAK